jgi:hypothetical protein
VDEGRPGHAVGTVGNAPFVQVLPTGDQAFDDPTRHRRHASAAVRRRAERRGRAMGMTVGQRRTTTVPGPVMPVLTIRRYIDHALICSACCR